jgi:hypothetical protein
MNTQRDLAVQLRASIKRDRLIATRLIAEIATATPPMIMVFRDQIIILECQEDCLALTLSSNGRTGCSADECASGYAASWWLIWLLGNRGYRQPSKERHQCDRAREVPRG